MNNIKQLSSLQNPIVKHVLGLKEKSRERKKSGQFLLEGKREFQLALKSNIKIDTLFFNPNIISQEKVLELIKELSNQPEIIELSKEVYSKIAYREKTEGIMAIGYSNSHELGSLELKGEKPLILVAEGIEKPGNIGALLRTADAANLDAVIIANPKTDLYNPNIIRSSVGCLFTTRIAVGSTMEVIEFLRHYRISIFAATLSGTDEYHHTDFSGASALVVGSESIGLSKDWIDNCDQQIIIPMQGEIDSMNVSVSAAILIFEAKRQRDFK